MTGEAAKTLFHPFEAEALALPQKGEAMLFLGAAPGFRLPQGFDAELQFVQGFRPDFRALAAAGHAVEPRVQGQSYAMALVLAGRHRGQNELRIAEAIERTAPGGLIVVAGSKDDGIASLRKRMDGLVSLEGHLPKHHGVAFWFHRPDRQDAASMLRAANQPMLVDGRFHTAPGMFSFDRIDQGSQLLADHLPVDLRGHVADFCAGWGFLAAQALARCPRVTALDLHEADFDALEAAKSNIADAKIPVRFFWTDLLGEAVEQRYDAIVMNPPFHRARAAEPEIGAGMVRAAAKALKPGGRLFMVANRQLPYEDTLGAVFSSYGEIAREGMFKVFAARR
jgi:16S rRNA (guanine1207-N2)-methyltransferase